ncbi:MAG: type II toxin-antitoxin system VapB family antitoxin [Candidatus Eremiobacteraeota bacterium]|nr:type II toxin-antitoxin system VapB family antitoxin [Candidatus Eremiobacteraeota bacterium]MCW5871760.1 type II toxin-antitoxin system VapB family antitoxin [Candidatus Eremiobacteraeota bacterium]
MTVRLRKPSLLFQQLASELASLTEETMTEAITVALRERLDRLEPENPPDHASLLYDERGLPA